MSEIITLDVDTSSKEFMFHLGELFALGKKISIKNIDAVNENIKKEKELGYAKSFNMMIKYWADNSLSLDLNNITAKPNNIFLICPVRNATEKEKGDLRKLFEKYEARGFHVHYPQRDTNQNPIVNGTNTGGYNICAENARAIANARRVVVFYNKESVGSMFDLGVTYQLMKNNPARQIFVANSFKYDSTNVIDKKITEMIGMNKENNKE